MKLDAYPLIDAIERLIAKADDDLEQTLEAEGFVAAGTAVEYVNAIEDAYSEAVGSYEDDLLKALQAATGVDNFISDIWPGIKDADDLEKALKKIFKSQFDSMFRELTFNWVLGFNPDAADAFTDDGRITKPAEYFIKSWSEDLAKLMRLNTNTIIEDVLLQAAEKGLSIDETADLIADRGIRSAGYRSRRVALTEVLRTESYAELEGMRQDPYTIKKVWKHTDAAIEPRENHIAMDGQTAYVDEPFELVGADGATYHPMCPRDTSLPAKETVNCHCIMGREKDDKILGMTLEELKAARLAVMDKVDADWAEKIDAVNAARAAMYDEWGVYRG